MSDKTRHTEFLSHDTKWELEGDRDSILITPKNLDGPITDPQFELSLSEALALRKALSYVLGETEELIDVSRTRLPSIERVMMSEEIRTTSSTGAEKGVKPERYDLIPVEALAAVARLYGQGAKKYAAHNWRKGYEWSKSYAALQRHANAFWAGEEIDPEMGESHMACVIFHALSLITFTEEQREFDDRYNKPLLDTIDEPRSKQKGTDVRINFYNSLGPNKSATDLVEDIDRILGSTPKLAVDPFEKPRPIFVPRTSEEIGRDILKSWGAKASKSPKEGDAPMRNENEIKVMVIPNAAQVLSIEGTPNKTEFARTLLKNALNHRIREEGSEDAEYGLSEIYVVSFTYTLGNQKAMLSTTRENNKYYELTYDVLNQVAYVDTYVKQTQTILTDI